SEDAVRLLAERVDAAVVPDCDVAADVACATVAADRDVEVARAARVRRRLGRFGERTGNCEAAVAAATTDALGKHTVRELAQRLNVAGVGHVDRAAFAAAAAFAANAHADRGEVGRRRAGDAETAVAATAAEALRAHTVGLRTVRVDVCTSEHVHRAAVARGSRGAANADRHLRRLRDPGADAEAAIAAAAAEAERGDAVRAAAKRLDDAG